MNLISRVWMRVKSDAFVRLLTYRGVTVGTGTRFVGLPLVSLGRSGRVQFGDRVRVISDWRVATLGIEHPAIFRTLWPGAAIEIGHDVGMTGGTICAVRGVTIGAGTLLGANVTIADTDFHAIRSPARRYAPIPEPRPGDEIVIGANVFIGTGAIVLKGSTIGDNTVIGAGSVVSGTIPPDVVAAGVPARVVKRL